MKYGSVTLEGFPLKTETKQYTHYDPNYLTLL